MSFDGFKSSKAETTIFDLVILLSILLAGCSPQGDLKVGDTAPNFSIPDANGQVVSLSELRNEQPVLLFFHMAGG
jgi:hypothetical protein